MREYTQKTENTISGGDSGKQVSHQPQSHWARFYSSGFGVTFPSQFAAFVVSELYFKPEVSRILDLGCGNGRDSAFFGENGFEVLGVDASDSAIETAQKICKEKRLETVAFENRDLATLHALRGLDRRFFGPSTLIYARFFLHALTREEQNGILEEISSLHDPGGLLALKFRVTEDKKRPKVTPSHFREFSSLKKRVRDVKEVGFTVLYTAKGRGLAKFGEDDAIVGRIIAQKQSS